MPEEDIKVLKESQNKVGIHSIGKKICIESPIPNRNPGMKNITQKNIVNMFLAIGNSRKRLKGQGHIPVNKPFISKIYIVAHTWPLCSVQILVDGVNPSQSYF